VEQGGGKPLDVSPWFGIAGPAKLPPEIAAKIGAALDKAADNKEFLTQLDTLGAVQIRGSTSESYSQDVGREIEFWNKWAKEVGGSLTR
jgi:tripartite-type tricarboxylate transporter receptor subunit TctC